MRVYVDSNVFISALRDEIGFNFALLGRDSRLFFAACAKRSITVVISNLIMFEITKKIKLSESDIFGNLEELGVHFEFVITTDEMKVLAQKIQDETGIHYLDGLHVAIAIQKKCDYLVTWNMKDFEKTRNWIMPFHPESFLKTL